MSHAQYKVIGNIVEPQPMVTEEQVISNMINNESIQLVFDKIRPFMESLDYRYFTEMSELMVDSWHWLITWSKSIPERTFIVASVLLFIVYMVVMKMKKNQM